MQGKVKLFEELIAAQNGRLILWLPVMAMIGSAFYFSLKFEPMAWMAGGYLVISGILVAGLWRRRMDGMGWRLVWGGMMLLLWTGIGFGAAQWRTAMVAAPVLEKRIRVAHVTGTVAAVDILESGQRLVLQDLEIARLPPEKTPAKIRVKIREEEDVPVGARVRFTGTLSPPSAPVLPGAFDFQRHAYFQRLGAYGFTFKPLEFMATPGPHSLTARLEQARQDIVGRLSAQMSAREAGIAAALMIGERGAVLDADWEAMRVSGLAHMLSISGMHVGLVAALVFFMTRFLMALVPPLALRYPIKKYAALLALLAAAFYTGLAVPSVPSYRSLLMSAFILLAVMVERKPFSMRTIALAALVVVLVTPEAVLSPSFQMSFAATAALIFFFEETAVWWAKMRREAGPVKRGLIYLGGVCGTTLAAGTATMPFAIYHFQQFTSYGMLGNLLAVPVLSFVVMPMVVLAFIVMPFGGEKPVLWVMEKGIATINVISYGVTDLPYAQFVMVWPLAGLILICVGGIGFMLWGGKGRLWFMLVPMVAGFCVIFMHRSPDIVVSADASLMAVRLEDGQVALSNIRRDKFTRNIWLRHLGKFEDEGVAWPREGAGPGGMLCDPKGCRIEIAGQKVAFSLMPEGLVADCAWADVLVAKAPLRDMDCDAGIIVDRFDVWREGAHAVWVEDMSMQSVAKARGVRPWTTSNLR